MAIVVNGKTYRYYPYDAFYVNGAQVKEAYFNGVKYYPEDMKPPAKIVVTHIPSLADYSDIVVVAYTADNEIWRDASHPNGVIPFNELTFRQRGGSFSTKVPWFPTSTVRVKELTTGQSTHYGVAVSSKVQECLEEVFYDANGWVDKSDVPDHSNWQSNNGFKVTSTVPLYSISLVTKNNVEVAGGYGPDETPPKYHRVAFAVAYRGNAVDLDDDTPLYKTRSFSAYSSRAFFRNTTKGIWASRYARPSDEVLDIGGKAVTILFDTTNYVSLPNEVAISDSYVVTMRGTPFVLYGTELNIDTYDDSYAIPPALYKTTYGTTEQTFMYLLWNYFYGGPVECQKVAANWISPQGTTLTANFDRVMNVSD